MRCCEGVGQGVWFAEQMIALCLVIAVDELIGVQRSDRGNVIYGHRPYDVFSILPTHTILKCRLQLNIGQEELIVDGVSMGPKPTQRRADFADKLIFLRGRIEISLQASIVKYLNKLQRVIAEDETVI